MSRAATRGRFFGIAVGAPRVTDGDDAVAFWVRDPFGASVASSSSGGASCGDTPRGDTPRGDGGAPRAGDRGAASADSGHILCIDIILITLYCRPYSMLGGSAR